MRQLNYIFYRIHQNNQK